MLAGRARPQPLVKAGRLLLGKVDALHPDCKSERTYGGESLRHFLGGRSTAQNQE